MHNTLEREIVFLSPGVLTDAGGFEIIIVSGKVTIVPVPGWEAEARIVFDAALAVLGAAKAVGESDMRERLQAAAQNMLQSQAHVLSAYAGNGRAAAGA
ncbi:MAG: hypothetical protein M3R53_09560 [Candidatus Eremiobacteraeota bacterium]|nr:hypothetical protein [Candidatus Eremiobacteraeota bacterium]